MAAWFIFLHSPKQELKHVITTPGQSEAKMTGTAGVIGVTILALDSQAALRAVGYRPPWVLAQSLGCHMVVYFTCTNPLLRVCLGLSLWSSTAGHVQVGLRQGTPAMLFIAQHSFTP